MIRKTLVSAAAGFLIIAFAAHVRAPRARKPDSTGSVPSAFSLAEVPRAPDLAGAARVDRSPVRVRVTLPAPPTRARIFWPKPIAENSTRDARPALSPADEMDAQCRDELGAMRPLGADGSEDANLRLATAMGTLRSALERIEPELRDRFRCPPDRLFELYQARRAGDQRLREKRSPGTGGHIGGHLEKRGKGS